ncbi:MAG: hypothetical protein JJ896_07535 [Rhodothermales bacterium]|nr:hypothetical protein [Rhodothermales bacterium]MBO6779490.1 hypothetical protein [Rhodothermales bacterium]
MKTSEITREAPLTDEEIDLLVGRALRDAGVQAPLESTRGPRSLRGLIYVGAFLLGMTVMEGFHLMNPSADVRSGEMVFRCGVSQQVDTPG